jgi:hypothetical protein
MYSGRSRRPAFRDTWAPARAQARIVGKACKAINGIFRYRRAFFDILAVFVILY